MSEKKTKSTTTTDDDDRFSKPVHPPNCALCKDPKVIESMRQKDESVMKTIRQMMKAWVAEWCEIHGIPMDQSTHFSDAYFAHKLEAAHARIRARKAELVKRVEARMAERAQRVEERLKYEVEYNRIRQARRDGPISYHQMREQLSALKTKTPPSWESGWEPFWLGTWTVSPG